MARKRTQWLVIGMVDPGNGETGPMEPIEDVVAAFDTRREAREFRRSKPNRRLRIEPSGCTCENGCWNCMGPSPEDFR